MYCGGKAMGRAVGTETEDEGNGQLLPFLYAFVAYPSIPSFSSFTFNGSKTSSSIFFCSASSVIPSDASALLAFQVKADLKGKLGFSSNSTLGFCKWNGVQCSEKKVVRLVCEKVGLDGVFAPDTLTRLDQLRVLSLQDNSLAGPIPDLSRLVNLKVLFLDRNFFTGIIPPSISTLHRLKTLDLSHNNLTGNIPAFFNEYSLRSHSGDAHIIALQNDGVFLQQSALRQNAQLRDGGLYSPEKKSNKRSVLIIGLSLGFFVLICSIICFALAAKKSNKSISSTPKIDLDPIVAANTEAVMRIEEESNELEEKVKRVQEGMQVMGKSGNLVFSVGESQVYTLEQLMKASAELLGRGTLGTTYKAVLDNRLIVCVKRLDSGKMASRSKDEFERHMESVGGLRHPNLVPLRAFFQAKEERLLVYDYQPNGSLFALIHAWRLVHGNLKSSNVLLGSDFEACISDYCLSVLANPFSDDDPDCAAYKAPEARKLNMHHQATSKSDVYSYGVLVLELLTGKHPSEHPVLMPDEMIKWVRSTRDDDGGEENANRLEMILEVAMVCSVASPEQRPTMWQVLKMIQEIKDAAIMEDGREMDLLTGTS
nr:probable inactive receptor kinase At5g67200 [Ipomoea batatas]